MYPPIVLLHVWADELHYYCVTSLLTILRTNETCSVILFHLTECSEKQEPKYFIVLWWVFIWCGEDTQRLNRVCPWHVVYTYSTPREIIYSIYNIRSAWIPRSVQQLYESCVNLCQMKVLQIMIFLMCLKCYSVNIHAKRRVLHVIKMATKAAKRSIY